MLLIYGATLGGTFDSNGGQVTLLGTMSIAAGATDTVDFESATFGFTSDGSATLTGPGTLDSSGVVTVTDWGGNLQLAVDGGLTWDSSGTVYDSGTTQLSGGATWDNTGAIYDRYTIQFGAANGDSATIVNEAGALFDMNTGSSGLTSAYTGTYVFENKGTLLQNGGGTDSIGVPLVNSGLVESTNGLLLVYGATLGGTFQSNGGEVALLGTSSIASGVTDTVTLESAYFGYYNDGVATLTGPGTLSSSGVATVTDWGGNLQLALSGGPHLGQPPARSTITAPRNYPAAPPGTTPAPSTTATPSSSVRPTATARPSSTRPARCST